MMLGVKELDSELVVVIDRISYVNGDGIPS